MLITITNQILTATINTVGAELVSLEKPGKLHLGSG